MNGVFVVKVYNLLIASAGCSIGHYAVMGMLSVKLLHYEVNSATMQDI